MAMSIKQLFPSDIINIILQYTDNNIIIQLQDYFPDSLKYITINISLKANKICYNPISLKKSDTF